MVRSRFEVIIAATTTIGVVAVGVMGAWGIAIIDMVPSGRDPHDAVLGWVEKAGRYGDVCLHPSAGILPSVLVYRLDDGLLFANTSYVRGGDTRDGPGCAHAGAIVRVRCGGAHAGQ